MARTQTAEPATEPTRGTTKAAASRTPTALADLAVVHRGVATGANWFFVLSEAEREELDIPLDYVRPLMRRLRDAGSNTIKDRPWLHPASARRRANTAVAEMAWLLVTGPQPSDNAVLDYINLGERNDAHKPLLCDQRAHWHDLSTQVHDVDLAISPMSKGTFRVLEAPPRAAVLNNLYGLTWKENLSVAKQARTLTFLRSPAGQAAIRRSARSQANGLLKIEPKAFGAITIA